MRPFTFLFCLCLAVPALAQDAPSVGELARSAVLTQYTLNPLSLVPDTHQPLPSTGKWSIRTSRPDSCPHDDSPCVRVVYTVAEAHVACEWTVVPEQGSAPAAFLDQNEDASRYLLRKLAVAELAPLVLTSPQPTYPPIARAAHVTGSVVVRVVVAKDGTVSLATPVRGPEMLRASAVEPAKHWTFRPLQVGTQAAPFVAEVTANFSLEKNVPYYSGPNGLKIETRLPNGGVTLHP